jgi:positive regulator of sigma E activity
MGLEVMSGFSRIPFGHLRIVSVCSKLGIPEKTSLVSPLLVYSFRGMGLVLATAIFVSARKWLFVVFALLVVSQLRCLQCL